MLGDQLGLESRSTLLTVVSRLTSRRPGRGIYKRHYHIPATEVLRTDCPSIS